MKRTVPFLLMIGALLAAVACGGSAPAAEPTAVAQIQTAVPATPLPDPTLTEAAPELPTAVPVDTPAEPTAAPTEPEPEPEIETEVEVTAEPEAEPAVEAPNVGRTAEGALFRGREDAPVTIIDYSDFL